MAKGLRGIAIASGLVQGLAANIERGRKRELEEREHTERQERLKLSQRQVEQQEKTANLNAIVVALKLMEDSEGQIDATTAETIAGAKAGSLAQVKKTGVSQLTETVLAELLRQRGYLKDIETPGEPGPGVVRQKLGPPKASEVPYLAQIIAGQSPEDRERLAEAKTRLKIHEEEATKKTAKRDAEIKLLDEQRALAEMKNILLGFDLPYAADKAKLGIALLRAQVGLTTAKTGLANEEKDAIAKRLELTARRIELGEFSATDLAEFRGAIMKAWQDPSARDAIKAAFEKALGKEPGQPAPPPAGPPGAQPAPSAPAAPPQAPAPPSTTPPPGAPSRPGLIRDKQTEIFKPLPAPPVPQRGGAIEPSTRFAKTTLPNTQKAIEAIPGADPEELRLARQMLQQNPDQVRAAGVDPDWLEVALNMMDDGGEATV